jgi:hypothetical protein
MAAAKKEMACLLDVAGQVLVRLQLDPKSNLCLRIRSARIVFDRRFVILYNQP